MNPYITMILFGIIGLALFFIAFKVLKLFMKVILIALSVVILIMVVMGFFIISDIRDIKGHFETDSNIVLVSQQDTYTNGRLYPPGKDGQKLEPEQLEYYNNLTIEQIAKENYKVFIIKPVGIEQEEDLNILQKPVALFKSYKDGDVEIYPQTRTSKIISKVPDWLIIGAWNED